MINFHAFAYHGLISLAKTHSCISIGNESVALLRSTE